MENKNINLTDEQKQLLKDTKENFNIKQKQEKENQKKLKKKIFLIAKTMLFDTLQNEIINDYLTQDKIYKKEIKEKIIDTIILKLENIYILTDETKEELNFFIYNNYYQIASKVITIVKKEQNIKIYEKNVEKAKKILKEQKEKPIKQEQEKNSLIYWQVAIIILLIFIIPWIFTPLV